MNIEPIGFIRTDFPDKFGIPRQSGLLDRTEAVIEFVPPYNDPDAFRDIACWSHLWLIWLFDRNTPGPVHLTVRPPRLGGNRRVGVFATRSPYRPNPLGLSCVRLTGTEVTPDKGMLLHVAGADLCDGTPILDIKPYVPYADCRQEASSGFSVDENGHVLRVICAEDLLACVPPDKRDTLLRLLSLDPRPAYHDDEREYGVSFAGFNIRFSVSGKDLTVRSVQKQP